jgi:hypothetical protein
MNEPKVDTATVIAQKMQSVYEQGREPKRLIIGLCAWTELVKNQVISLTNTQDMRFFFPNSANEELLYMGLRVEVIIPMSYSDSMFNYIAVD